MLFLAICLVLMPGCDDTETAQITAVLDQFQGGIINKDAKLLAGVFINEKAVLYGVMEGVHPGGYSEEKNSASGFVEYITTSSIAMDERLGKLSIHAEEGVASVVCDYVFHMDDIVSNYGVNMFSLVKTVSGWKIASIVWTVTVTDEMKKRIQEDPEILKR